jgi:hypothetical protein
MLLFRKKKRPIFISNSKYKYLLKILKTSTQKIHNKDAAIFMANKQIFESTSDILKAAPSRALERLRHCILTIAADILKLPHPLPVDDEIPAFCKAFQKTLTLQEMIQVSLKMLPDPSIVMNMGIADLIELLCFGSIRDLVAKHYTKFLSTTSPSITYTVPAFIKDITESYSKITHHMNFGNDKYSPEPIPNRILYSIDTLVDFPEFLQKQENKTSLNVPELFVSKFMRFSASLKTVHVHPFQILVIDIVSFIVNSIQVDLNTVKKSISFTLSSLSDYLY